MDVRSQRPFRQTDNHAVQDTQSCHRHAVQLGVELCLQAERHWYQDGCPGGQAQTAAKCRQHRLPTLQHVTTHSQTFTRQSLTCTTTSQIFTTHSHMLPLLHHTLIAHAPHSQNVTTHSPHIHKMSPQIHPPFCEGRAPPEQQQWQQFLDRQSLQEEGAFGRPVARSHASSIRRLTRKALHVETSFSCDVQRPSHRL